MKMVRLEGHFKQISGVFSGIEKFKNSKNFILGISKKLPLFYYCLNIFLYNNNFHENFVCFIFQVFLLDIFKVLDEQIN